MAAAGTTVAECINFMIRPVKGVLPMAMEAKALGFDGKGCIHPRQIEVIHRGFTPTEAEIEKAKRIVIAFDEAQKKGLSVVSLGSKMVDPPVVRRAQRTMELAIAAGVLAANWREGGGGNA